MNFYYLSIHSSRKMVSAALESLWVTIADAPTRWRIACSVTPADGRSRTGKLLRFVDDRFLLDKISTAAEIAGLESFVKTAKVKFDTLP